MFVLREGGKGGKKTTTNKSSLFKAFSLYIMLQGRSSQRGQMHLLPANVAQLSIQPTTLSKLEIFNMSVACADISS